MRSTRALIQETWKKMWQETGMSTKSRNFPSLIILNPFEKSVMTSVMITAGVAVGDRAAQFSVRWGRWEKTTRPKHS